MQVFTQKLYIKSCKRSQPLRTFQKKFQKNFKKNKKILKKVLTKREKCDNINELSQDNVVKHRNRTIKREF